MSNPVVRSIAVSGQVRDWNENAQENYKNGNVFIVAQIMSGGLRDVGDPTYGFLVTLTNSRTNKTYSIGLGTGNNSSNTQSAIDNYAKGIELTRTYAGVSATDNLVITLRMSPNSTGTLAVGSAITIDMRLTGTYPDQTTELWKNLDTIDVIISGRDPQTMTGYDGAYLSGVSYTA